MSPVWSTRIGSGPDPLILEYCSGRDVVPLPMADEQLIGYDLWNTEAHDIMLYKQGVLGEEDLGSILTALQEIREKAAAGLFSLDPEKEDVHMNVESAVTDHSGADAGRRIHAGRSRNDQIVCDMRMYLRERLLGMAESTVDLAEGLLERGRQESDAVMPGFSHTRHATMSTFGHLLISYAQALLRDVQRFLFAYTMVNINPLGAAAGFGTSWPLDRELTTRLLGFDSVQENSIDCLSSRWEAEAQAASAVSFLMNHLSVVSQDLIFLSTSEAGMVSLDDGVVTGSSIMPQKRNPDPLEVTRAKAAMAHMALQALLSVEKGALSGYNRDSQYTKYLIMDMFRECEKAPQVIGRVVEGLVVNRDRMAELSGRDFLNAVDVADHLSRAFDLPFRQSYHVVASAVRSCSARGRLDREAINAALVEEGIDAAVDDEIFEKLDDPIAVVSAKNHIGGPAPQALIKNAQNLAVIAESLRTEILDRRAGLSAAWEQKEALARRYRK